MISLPDAIVIYPQKKSAPDYLLCWIPAKEYPRVVLKPEKQSELEKLYPKGIEIELSEDSLQEADIALGVTPELLQQAYLDLLHENMVPDSGMVELADLEVYLSDEQTGLGGEIAPELAGQVKGIDELLEGDTLLEISSAPPMTEGNEASQVYRRLDVKQYKSSRGDQGG